MICDDFFYVRCAQGKINLREKMVYGAWAKEEDRRESPNEKAGTDRR